MGALRALLALAVVLSHTGGIYGYVITGGVVAVETFFILSGFLIAMVLSEKYNFFTDKLIFYRARALRIFVPYYVALVFAVVIALFTQWWSDSGFIAQLRALNLSPLTLLGWGISHITVIGQEIPLFLYSPTETKIISAWAIPPAWSISLELLFYIVAPFLVRLSTSWLAVLALLSFGARAFGGMLGYSDDPWLYRFLPFEAVFFIAGILAYRLAPTLNLSKGKKKFLCISFLLACFLCQPVIFVLKKIGVPEVLPRWVFYIAAVFVIPILFQLTRNSKADAFFANFSYPVYLLHWPIISLYDSLQPGTNGLIRTLACVVLTFAAAWCLTSWVERPLDRYRHRLSAQRGVLSRGPTAIPSITV